MSITDCVCEILTDLSSDPDSAMVRLALAHADLKAVIANLELALADDPRLDDALRTVHLEALREALAALEAEMEATPC